MPVDTIITLRMEYVRLTQEIHKLDVDILDPTYDPATRSKIRLKRALLREAMRLQMEIKRLKRLGNGNGDDAA